MNPADDDPADDRGDELAQRLIEMGRRIHGPAPPSDLVQRVLERDPVGLRRRRTVRRRLSIAVAIALLIIAGFTPGVRAAVTDLLRIGGVLIQPGPAVSTPTMGADPTDSSGPIMPSGTAMTVDEARQAVDFELALPADLGEPDEVIVSDDRRVVSMRWEDASGVIIWDQFDGRLSPVFRKQVGADVESAPVHGLDGVWVRDAHPIIYVDADGVEHTAGARLAGPTLIFVRDDVTVRLEGELSKHEAIRIAESAPR